MNQAMENAMNLEVGGEESPIPIQTTGGEMMEVSPDVLAMEGVGFAQQYMAQNGPTSAMHIRKAKIITKSQLEEQKVNENEGYPSNLDEAAKVKELEVKVGNIEMGIGQILDRLNNPTSQEVSPLSPPVTRSPLPTELPELKQPKKPREITLPDGRRIKVPMGLGTTPMSPSSTPSQVPEDLPVIQTPQVESDDVWSPVEAPIQDTPVPISDSATEKLATMVTQVGEFLQSNDTLRFFQRHLKMIHKYADFHGWPADMQREFSARFLSFLKDAPFVTNICSKVLTWDLGYAMAPKHVASLVVCSAGFTAMTLCGIV